MATGRTKLGAFLLGSAITIWTVPSHAGFEFLPASAPASQEAPVVDDAYLDSPMPIIPAAPVTAEPLDAPAASSAVPASSGDPVYIRRQRNLVMKAPKGQPMDTDALLKATENTQMVEMEGSPRVNQTGGNSGKLVINPYPLQADNAVHGGDMGTLSVEQAMMEQSGNLRTVAVPGKGSASGMIARAKMASRYDRGTQYIQRSDAVAAEADLASITPIPGGDSAKLGNIEATPLASAKMPRPATPENYTAPAGGGYAQAVGFGRDLPLALALSQVVPAEYSYAFGKNVDVSASVSWQGGKPWPEVLNDMLAQSGMVAIIDNNQITIQAAHS